MEIIAQGAWNGGTLVDNSIYENKGMAFKGGIPVNHETIEERIGVRTRMAAPMDERIGVMAFTDLLETSGIDPARIRVLIGATNIGEDKLDPGPVSRSPTSPFSTLPPGPGARPLCRLPRVQRLGGGALHAFPGGRAQAG